MLNWLPSLRGMSAPLVRAPKDEAGRSVSASMSVKLTTEPAAMAPRIRRHTMPAARQTRAEDRFSMNIASLPDGWTVSVAVLDRQEGGADYVECARRTPATRAVEAAESAVGAASRFSCDR